MANNANPFLEDDGGGTSTGSSDGEIEFPDSEGEVFIAPLSPDYYEPDYGDSGSDYYDGDDAEGGYTGNASGGGYSGYNPPQEPFDPGPEPGIQPDNVGGAIIGGVVDGPVGAAVDVVVNEIEEIIDDIRRSRRERE
jgi:hypothetical protein